MKNKFDWSDLKQWEGMYFVGDIDPHRDDDGWVFEEEAIKILDRINKKVVARIYLDDVRTPIPGDIDWTVVRSYDEFVSKVTEIGLDNIDLISLDHDLGDSAMQEWHTNVYHNYTLDYNNITEKTGMDCAKWLVEQWLDGSHVVKVMVHSANAIGSANIMGYINNYKHVHRMPQDCQRWIVPHTV